jgi:outer membrane protein assembly factor BamB
MTLTRRLLLPLLCASVVSSSAAEPWATYRGNPQRTGCTDNQPGPAAPKVLWAFKGNDHFVAAPLPQGDRLYIAGLSGFNVPTLYALDTEPKAAERVAWKKSLPFLRLPSVSTPAVAGGKLIFGAGMHQDDKGVLYCLRAEKGQPTWELPMLGNLIHLEGSPTVHQGRVYIGGGSAGVLCLDLERVTLEGREMDLAAIQKVIDKKWAELQAQYEKDKKENPLTAIPPTEDQLPRPAPVPVWQQGKERWHVDAPVALVDDVVLVATAFLEKEQAGDRALVAMEAKKGEIKWRTPLKLNPWGGPSVLGKTVVVTGSTIGYSVAALKGAKGDVAAFDLADGKEKWRKEVPGGVIGCAALVDGVAVVTATDGKVRAFDLESGERRWIYDAKTPFFAPVAVSAGVAYAGDLKGVIHAIDLQSGAAKWTLDLGADPAVKAPGMVYGGPVLQGGRLYVATANLEGVSPRPPAVVACLGDK